MLVRRAIFLLVAASLTLGNLFPLFRGLSTQQAMDQAQIGREVARGNGLSTKFIRPVELAMAEAAAGGGSVAMTKFHDTMHAPLYPLVLGAVFKVVDVDAERYQMDPAGSFIFPLDRVVAGVSTVFFLLSILMSHRLACRIFDAKIAGVTAILMLFSGLFWDFATSGLPQMAMLFLFSCGMYFAYLAVEATREERSAVVPAIAAGLFFSLMSLTHWLALWILLGYLIYAAVVFRPRGVISIGIVALVLGLIAWPVVSSIQHTGSPFGSAGLVLQEALGNHPPDKIMRAASKEAYQLDLKGIVMRIGRTVLVQVTDLLPFLGGILAAPLFFLTLLHTFKRPAIASFRWMVLVMWVMATVGMAIYGVAAKDLHPNQVHLLFAPIMTAYGLAFLAVLWSRLELPERGPVFANGHLIVVVLISALPLLLALPDRIRDGMNRAGRGIPQWPPYVPPVLNVNLHDWVAEEQIVVSDQPWAVAWYADRVSVWLPLKREAFERLEERAGSLGTPLAGVLITPSSYGSADLDKIPDVFEDFTSLVLDGPMVGATLPQPTALFEVDPKLEGFRQRYPYRIPLLGQQIIYYAKQPPR
jgi:hypothetical protein